MFFSFGSPDDGRGSRSGSLASIFQHVPGKNRRPPKSAMSMVETADEFLMMMPEPPPRKQKRSTITGFLRGWGNGKMSNKARHQASRILKPPSPKGYRPQRPQQMKSLDIDDAVLERVMGKTKDEKKQASENFLLQQRIRARSRSRTRGANSTDEPRRHGGTRPLTTEEAQDMFVGAPFFNVGKIKNGYRPQVVFVDEKSKLYTPGSTDHAQLTHPSFFASTLATEVPVGDAKAVLTSSRAALQEVPSMYSSSGAEMGTTSFEHFLQLAISDSSRYAAEMPRSEKRRLLYLDPEQLGLRESNTDANVERLSELGAILKSRYDDNDMTIAMTNEFQISRMGEELFTKTLSLPSAVEMQEASLRAQIEALQRTLGMKEMWHDFSQPDTRLKVGQLLWSATSNTGRRPSLFDKELQPSDREVVLLQVTLAAELLLRLAIVRAVSSVRGRAPAFFSESDRVAVESQRTAKVNWDLVLAERFLDNVDISMKAPEKSNKNGLFGVISQFASKEDPEPFYQPKNQEQQISGLAHFAKSIQWPDADGLETRLIAKLVDLPKEHASSPPQDEDIAQVAPSPRRQSGFTGEVDPSLANEKAQRFLGVKRVSRRSSRPGSHAGSRSNSRSGSRPGTARSEQSGHRYFGGRQDTAHNMQLHKSVNTTSGGEDVNVGGWMSRSWLSGLVMPGDVTSHLLISTLLENTPNVLNKVGQTANLQSGFIYSGRSYWSKACAIGRVMAASKGAVECMGWISIPGAPLGHEEGWVEAELKEVPYCDASTARITDSEAIGRDSDPMPGELMAVQHTDFTSPHDGFMVMGNEARSQGLAFTESYFAGEAPIPSITFSSPNSKLANMKLAITYDVHFVSSYPCHPEMRKPKVISKPKPKPKRKPTPEPDFSGDLLPSDFVMQYEEEEEYDEAGTDRIGEELGPKDSARCSTSPSAYIMPEEATKEMPPPPCHPLHNDYRYEMIPVATLLSKPPAQWPLSVSDGKNVVVLDCRGIEDLQLLARAWCAKIGENAIVAKVGRTCLACSIREANALGFSVVIRV